jgi:type IV secretory pathway TraG/TraD family ATPase VirD4
MLQYFRDLWNTVKSISENRFPQGVNFINLMTVGVPSGSILFFLYRVYVLSRPEWSGKRERRGRVKLNSRMKRRLESAEHPEDGTVLGMDYEGTIVKVSDRELNGHCLVLGATGAGKTTTLMNFIESAAERGIPLIIVDGKGELEFAERVRKIAEGFGRNFKLFSMKEDSFHYNPLRHGNFTEIKDKLISITEWTEPHYKLMSERYLQSAARVLMEAGERIDLVNVSEKVQPVNLEMVARELPENVSSRIFSIIDEVNEDIGGLLNRLAVFSESEIGELLSDTGDNDTIDLIESVEQNEVVFFSLDSLRFPEYSKLLGRLIVIDLKTTAARMFGKNKKVNTVFDEFGVFAGIQITDFINKSRGAGFHVILATQELADLRVEGRDELMEQILGNTNVKIIHRQDVPTSAELLASLIGTEDDVLITRQINESGITGLGSIREEKRFIVHPDDIKRLEIGEAFVLKKFPKFEVSKTIIRRAEKDRQKNTSLI